LQAFLDLITENKQYSLNNTSKVIDTKPNETLHKRNQHFAYKLKIIPSDPITIDGFTIDYKSLNSNKDKDGNLKDLIMEETTITITSKKPSKEIAEFIEKIYKNWVNKSFPIIQDQQEELLSFEQIPSDNQLALFTPYPIPRNLNTLNELFFDQKDELIHVLKLFKEKQIHRLGIMMSGEPGGGKTSLARAIAVQFNLHIIVINLNLVKNDAQLKEIVQGNSVNYKINGFNQWMKIPANKRLYLLDDADCGSDLLMDRELKSKSGEIKYAISNAMYGMPYKTNMHIDSKKQISDDDEYMSKYYSSDKLTLKGILDVMDGITPMGGILILNTNRPDDIDNAIKRPGRIDIKLSLGKMSTQHANELIKHYGHDINVEIPNRLLMGCVIANMCIFAKDNNDLENKLRTEIVNQQNLIEMKIQNDIETEKIIDDISKKTQNKYSHINSNFHKFDINSPA
jgi:hypothetical protein